VLEVPYLTRENPTFQCRGVLIVRPRPLLLVLVEIGGATVPAAALVPEPPPRKVSDDNLSISSAMRRGVSGSP
jgi:hypothetical protein